MNLKELRARLEEIDTLVAKSESADEVRSLIDEMKELKQREKELVQLEQRTKEATMINGGVSGATIVERSASTEDKSEGADSEVYRRAWLKTIAVDQRGNHLFGKLTEEETRAFTFTTANTGAVVPVSVVNKITSLIRNDSPILDDATQSGIEEGFALVRHTEIKAGDATGVAEGTANEDEEDVFIQIPLTGVDVKKHVTITRKMKFQSIDAFEDWLVKHLADRIRVAKEKVLIARLDNEAPSGATKVDNSGIAAANILTEKTYSDESIRAIMSLIDADGEVVVYANSKTIWTGLAGIKDGDGTKAFIPNPMADPIIQGRIYGATVKKDSNLADNIAYFGVKGALLANTHAPLEIFQSLEAKTANTIITGDEIFDGGLENPKAFVKVTFKPGE